jgi:hypothetical protein
MSAVTGDKVMEQAAPSKMSAGIVWGGVLGVLTGLSALSVVAGPAVQSVAGIVGWVISIVMIVAAQLLYRGKAHSLSYGGAYLIAFLVSLFGAIVAAVVTFLVLSFVPGVSQAIRTAVEAQLATNPGAGDPDTMEMVANMMTSPVAVSILTAIGLIFQGLIVGLITSIFARKDAKPEAA